MHKQRNGPSRFGGKNIQQASSAALAWGKKHRCQMQEKVQVAFDARKFEQRFQAQKNVQTSSAQKNIQFALVQENL